MPFKQLSLLLVKILFQVWAIVQVSLFDYVTDILLVLPLGLE